MCGFRQHHVLYRHKVRDLWHADPKQHGRVPVQICTQRVTVQQGRIKRLIAGKHNVILALSARKKELYLSSFTQAHLMRFRSLDSISRSTQMYLGLPIRNLTAIESDLCTVDGKRLALFYIGHKYTRQNVSLLLGTPVPILSGII